MITATFNTTSAEAYLKRVQAALSAQAVDGVVEEAARRAQRDLIVATPKKWFGQARAGWTQPSSVLKPAAGVRIVRWNMPPGITAPIMLWIEEGTKDHGPVRARALFIPLTRAAAAALTSGTFSGMGSVPTENGTRSAIYIRTQSVRKGVEKHGIKALVEGVDYIWRKHVRGISARHIVSQERPKAAEAFKKLMVQYLQKVIKGGR